MKFEMNNEEWEIFIVPKESIKDRYNDVNEYTCEGYSAYNLQEN